MKLSYIGLILFSIMFSRHEKLEDEFLKYEEQKKTIAISLNKRTKGKKEGKRIKLKKDHFFELVPPEYEVIFDTVMTFDPSNFSPEIKVLYKLSEELYIKKEGGYKWIIENDKLDLCNQEYSEHTFREDETILKFVKQPNEYGKRTFLSVKTYPTHTTIKDPEKRQKMFKRAFDLAKLGKIQQITKFEKIKKNGHLKKRSIDEIKELEKMNENLLILKKGCYNISQIKSLQLSCEPSLKNIQIALKRLGYETNTDGEATNKYEAAKYLFIREHNLKNNQEVLFLRRLGFEK